MMAGAAGSMGLFASGGASAKSATQPADASGRPSWTISLNTSTLRGHKLPLTETIDIAAKAGYTGIEPWPDEIDRHLESGGTLKDLRHRLDDHGLGVTGAIAFFEWMVDDDATRAKALDEAKHRMAQLDEIGGTHVAAPPRGEVEHVDLLAAAERYHDLLEASESFNVIPAVEIWGFAKNCYRLGQAVLIALEARHPRACILPDVYHLYKGGSGLTGVRGLSGQLIGGFHFNDYPANPPRERIEDKDRVYPGDGIAPLPQLFRDLHAIGYPGPLSIELFNPTYWEQEPFLVAQTALDKTQAVIRDAMT